MTSQDATPDVVVVGAGAAGLSTVEALRRRGHRGRITLLGAEAWAPYDRPPLSKQVLAGTWSPDRARLRPDEALAALEVELLLGDAATALDPAAGTVATGAGRTLAADAVVIATGARPRRLPGRALSGVHVVRTLDDALGLRADLRPGRRLVVVGDGVLGTEVAATARSLGVTVTLTGPQPLPMAAQLGPLVAGVLADLHRERGVDLLPGTATTALIGDDDGRVTGVELESGEVLPADVVVVALGCTPDVGWLAGSGLTLDDGVVCDAHCRAAPGVFAVGDVARFQHAGLGRAVRLENRTNAAEQAGAVAENVLAGPDAQRVYAPVPQLWTDQYDAKLQIHGLTGGDTTATVVEGDLDRRRFVVAHHRAGALVGVLGWAMPKQTLRLRRELAGFFAAAPPVPALTS